jgi:hypothetical protein
VPYFELQSNGVTLKRFIFIIPDKAITWLFRNNTTGYLEIISPIRLTTRQQGSTLFQ